MGFYRLAYETNPRSGALVYMQERSSQIPPLRLKTIHRDAETPGAESITEQSQAQHASKLLDTPNEADVPALGAMSYEEERSKRVLYTDPELHLAVRLPRSAASCKDCISFLAWLSEHAALLISGLLCIRRQKYKIYCSLGNLAADLCA